MSDADIATITMIVDIQENGIIRRRSDGFLVGRLTTTNPFDSLSDKVSDQPTKATRYYADDGLLLSLTIAKKTFEFGAYPEVVLAAAHNDLHKLNEEHRQQYADKCLELIDLRNRAAAMIRCSRRWLTLYLRHMTAHKRETLKKHIADIDELRKEIEK